MFHGNCFMKTFYFIVKLNITDVHKCTGIHLHVSACVCSGVHSLAHLTWGGLLFTFLSPVSFHSITSIISSPTQFSYAHD